MEWLIDRERILRADRGLPRYELIAEAIESAIVDGSLRSGERLSTVRELAMQLGVSGTTIAAAYNLLSEKGWIRSEVGRGTFVTSPQIGGTFIGTSKERNNLSMIGSSPLVTDSPAKTRRFGVSRVVPW